MTKPFRDTGSLALPARHPRRKPSKIAWLGGAALGAGEALLGVDMTVVLPVLGRLRCAPGEILGKLYPKRGGPLSPSRPLSALLPPLSVPRRRMHGSPASSR